MPRPAAVTARDRPLRHLVLAGLTLLTTSFTFHVVFGGPDAPLAPSLAFGATLVLILGSHELGHWFLAKHHRVDVSLPYFLPTPMLGFGTLGAVIRIRGGIPHRNALVDIGASGPLVGLAVALPLLLWGLSHSPVVPAMATPFEPGGPGTLWWMGERLPDAWRTGSLAPLLATSGSASVGIVFGDNLLLWSLKRWVLQLPPGFDVAPHPVVIAAWMGLLVTMLNLLPIGQLDGGHLAYALFGKRARSLGRATLLLLVGLALFASAGWSLWLLLTMGLIGTRHPPVLDEAVPLDRSRTWICAACAVALVLCLIPVPMRAVVT